ncbi:MAG: nucleotidyltransferase domain-containing protein [Nanoarchaeota archaeon]|nr:nucleotidyltransferase domain-containing protein [Nanoarchaeota archaeon]
MTSKKKNKDVPQSYRKILHYFFSFPQETMSLNDIAKNTGISKTSAKITVARLIKEGFLKKEAIGNAWRIYIADQKDPFMMTRKIPYNLELIYGSGIIAKVYSKIPEAKAIILFGSYRWGADNEKSDIDIGIEVLGNREMRIESLETLDNLGFRRNIKVNLHIFSRNKIDLNLFTNIANGIVLDGLLEVRP